MVAGCSEVSLLLCFSFGQVVLSFSLFIPTRLLMKAALWIPHFQTWCLDCKGQMNILNPPSPPPTLALRIPNGK